VREYNPFTTALTRTSLSVPMRELMNLCLFDLDSKCIDIGCGKGQDVEFLKYLGIDIVGYDRYNPNFRDDKLLESTYDTVTCNYVFNVIYDLQEHKGLLNKIKLLGNNIYISVRSDKKAIKDTWEYIEENDCWRTPKNTYQRFYTEEMISTYFGDVEYIINNGSLKLFKLVNKI
jgi:DNA phosphorothioation-associated putative methyltransferase